MSRHARIRISAGAVVLALIACAMLVNTTQGAGTSYTYTFDGDPGSPVSMYGMSDFDVQVHSRDAQNHPNTMTAVQGAHTDSCGAPGEQNQNGHTVTTPEGSVYQCKNHLMTTIRDDGYGLIELTPNRLLDWSDGEATLSIDVSTFRSSNRDWWDMYLTAWDAQLALPFSTGEVDLQGNPKGDYLHIDSQLAEKTFTWEGDNVSGPPGWAQPQIQMDSAMTRSTYVLTIRKNGTFDFCKPDENICFAKNAQSGLNITQAVVQFGHHSYNPRKDPQFCSCEQIENTWHWDNLYMSDSVPFTIIRANERYQLNAGTLTFSSPAPANSYLRFSAIGGVKINGQSVSPQTFLGHEEHFSSYLVPIPKGATSVQYQGTSGWFGPAMIKDASVFSQSGGGGAAPTNTAVPPTNTPGSQPTNTPTKTPVAPTATPVPSVGGLPLTGNRIQWLGKDWYLHGANLPWYNWSCDFGCNGNGGVSSNAVKNAIEPVLTSAANAGMTNIRWWMFPGDPWQITTDANGTPTGINNAVFADIDAALALAEKHDLYYTFVLFSGPDGLPREWMTDSAKRTALANVLGTQLFRRYANNPHILSWEIMNEPEFKIWSGDYTEAEVVNTVKAIAAQANAETTSYVTVGSAMLDGLGMWTGAGLDYYEVHWYDYMQPGDWCAFCTDYATVRETYNLDAPLVIGEYYGGSDINPLQRLNGWYDKGYAGAWAWSLFPGKTSDNLAVDMSAATTFAANHSDDGPHATSGPPPTATPTKTSVPPTNTPSNTPTPTATSTDTPATATPTTTSPGDFETSATASVRSFTLRVPVTSTEKCTVDVVIRVVGLDGAVVYAKVYARRAFKAGQTRTFSFAWTPATSVPAGSYHVELAIIGSGGKVLSLNEWAAELIVD